MWKRRTECGTDAPIPHGRRASGVPAISQPRVKPAFHDPGTALQACGMSDRPPPDRTLGRHLSTASFHRDTGPATLFDRVLYKMAGRRKLKFFSAQLRRRLADEGAPTDELQQFDADGWELVAADVRADTGKFVKSTWVCSVDQERWVVVIGFKDTIERVTRLDGDGPASEAVTSGTLYRRVAQVNAELMDAEE